MCVDAFVFVCSCLQLSVLFLVFLCMLLCACECV